MTFILVTSPCYLTRDTPGTCRHAIGHWNRSERGGRMMKSLNCWAGGKRKERGPGKISRIPSSAPCAMPLLHAILSLFYPSVRHSPLFLPSLIQSLSLSLSLRVYVGQSCRQMRKRRGEQRTDYSLALIRSNVHPVRCVCVCVRRGTPGMENDG